MEVVQTLLPGVLIIQPRMHRDTRGFFMETWQRERYQTAGIPAEFAQDNISQSTRGVLRGLHFQNPKPQGKLVTVIQGEIFDVAVDIRVGSPHFGKWTGILLSAEKGTQFWVPPGFAHGFCVTSTTATVSYKCSDIYYAEHEGSVLWNDPDIGISWPKMEEYFISEKDKKGFPLKAAPAGKLPRYL
jgi:dTDP-4-dehydrorhamnose 3,5-epimerase